MIAFRPGQIVYVLDGPVTLPAVVQGCMPDGRVLIDILGQVRACRAEQLALPPDFRPGDRIEVEWRIAGQVIWKAATVIETSNPGWITVLYDDRDPSEHSVPIFRRCVRRLHPDAPMLGSEATCSGREPLIGGSERGSV